MLEMDHNPILCGCGPSAGNMIKVDADSEWPTDTTRSEDIGGRRELVSRSKWCGERYRAEGKMDVRWSDGRRMRIALGFLSEGFTHGQSCNLNVTAWQSKKDF